MTKPEPEAPSHLQREVAESFGLHAERYDRTRPHYPDAMVTAIVAAGPGPDVLDVGVGTGIAARQFRAAGCRVLGIDPDERMAEYARTTGIEVEAGTLEAWDPAGRTFDAVVAGQAWHWVDPVAGAVRAARVLRPAGRLAVFWNAFEPPLDLSEAITAVYHRVLPDFPATQNWAPRAEGYAQQVDRAIDGMRATGAFGEPELWRFPWERHCTRAEWLDVVPTFGANTRLPPPVLQELLDGVGAAVDAVGGGFVMRFVALVGTAARTGLA